MKKKKALSFLALSLAGFALVAGGITFAKSSKKAEVTFATYTNGDGATYYNGIGDSLTGDSLLSALRSLNSNRRKTTVGYSSMGTTPSGQFKYTDYDESSVKYDSNGQPYGTKLISFYSGNSATSGMNREHVWPNSHGGNVIEADIHMPRPTIEKENGSRGNSFYVEGKCSSTAGWDPAMESFGKESYRGDSARIIFYCMLVDSRLSLIEADSHSTSNSNKDYMMGRLSDLIKWNINYPVLDREQRRNEGAEYLQGNRNPFIDHPEYACKIWGGANSTTQQLCANASYPTVSHSAGIRIDDGYNVAETNTTAYTLAIDESVHFLPFVDGAHNSSVSWTLSDYEIANSAYYSRSSYSNGVTITGKKEGKSTLTLSYSYDDNGETKYATAQVIITVTGSGSSGEGGDGGNADDVEGITSATYTVNTSSSVTTSGTAPSTSSATYSQSYTTTSQITANKNAILKLSGYDGKVITGITLNMRSNGSSGAGSFNATTGSSNIANTTGEFNTWYDNDSYGTSYRDVHVEMDDATKIVGTGEDVTLTITATKNSLYINSYTIYYGTPSEGGGTVETPTLVSISASGMTQNYVVGDTFSFDGILTAHYSDNNSEAVIPDSVTVPDMSTVGNKTITLTYEEGGIEKTTEYVIHVAEAPKVLYNISVETAPNKTSYTEGDKFDPTGLVIRRTYTDLSFDTYTYSGHSSDFSFNPSLTSALTTSNSSITITYGGKSTSQEISVSPAPFDNTIKDLYSKSQGSLSGNTFYGIYMGYTIHKNKYGTTTYYDLFIGNGDYAILLYGCYTSKPSFTAFETGLSVTGGYLKVFNNLYEVVNYNNSTNYTTTVNSLTASQISEYVAPISTYIITGMENGSTTSDQRTASRLATVTGEVKSLSGTITSSSDITVVIKLLNGNNANVFVKGNAGLDYSTLASKLVVGEDVTLRGFTSVYSTSYQLVNPEVVEASSTYRYSDFAQDVLDLTNSICSSSGEKEASLSAVWINLEINKFSILSSDDQSTLESYTANKDSSDVTARAMARYDQICKKYSSCTNFIGRSTANFAGAPYHVDVSSNETATTTIIVVVALLSVTSISILLVIKKRKTVGR